MKASLLTAAALAGMLALTGCAAASSDDTPPSAVASVAASASPSAEAAPQPAAPAAATPAPKSPAPAAARSTEGKVHFSGDYMKATAADTAKLLEVSKQWHSPEKEAALKAKMAGAGLASSIPQEQVDQGWYAMAAAVCQAKFDGFEIPVQGAILKISELVTGTYCPEVS